MKLLQNIVLVGCGAAIGSAVTYLVMRKKFAKITADEIESVKKSIGYYDAPEAEESEEVTDIPNQEAAPAEKNDFSVYKNLASQYERTDYVGYSVKKEGKEVNESNFDKYSIDTAGDEFAPIDDESYPAVHIVSSYDVTELDCDIINLYFTADGFAIDDDNEIQEPYQKYIGEEFRNYLREGGSDEIFVYNENYNVVYDVLRSAKYYDEFLNETPWVIRDDDIYDD